MTKKSSAEKHCSFCVLQYEAERNYQRSLFDYNDYGGARLLLSEPSRATSATSWLVIITMGSSRNVTVIMSLSS